jgi:WD40 repeat protein
MRLIRSLSFSCSGRLLAGGLDNGTLQEWAIAPDICCRKFTIPPHRNNSISFLAYLDGGKSNIITMTSLFDHPRSIIVRVWDCGGHCIFTLDYTDITVNPERFLVTSSQVLLAFYHTNESEWRAHTLDAQSSEGVTHKLGEVLFKWTEGLECQSKAVMPLYTYIQTGDKRRFLLHTNERDWSVSEDGKLAIFGGETDISIVDIEENRLIAKLLGCSDRVVALSFIPAHGDKDSVTYQCVSVSQDGTIRLWTLDPLLNVIQDQENDPMMSWHAAPSPHKFATGTGSWIKTRDRNPLFYLCKPFRHPLDRLLVGEYLDLDLSRFVHGEEWTKCREPVMDDSEIRQDAA